MIQYAKSRKGRYMNDIKLLDKAIEIYSNGNQAKFSKFSHIKRIGKAARIS